MLECLCSLRPSTAVSASCLGSLGRMGEVGGVRQAASVPRLTLGCAGNPGPLHIAALRRGKERGPLEALLAGRVLRMTSLAPSLNRDPWPSAIRSQQHLHILRLSKVRALRWSPGLKGSSGSGTWSPPGPPLPAIGAPHCFRLRSPAHLAISPA